MKLHIKTHTETDPLLAQMAKEAGVGLSDLVEIAIYNLISVWMKDRGYKTPEDALSIPISALAIADQRPIARF